MHICTTCDSKYIHKGLALYQSLINTMGAGNFTLHWLCFDYVLYAKLNQLALPEIKTYSLHELEDMNPELRNAKNNPKSNYGDEYSQYCWTLTPWFIHWLLTYGGEDIKQLLYADSDIFFYESPQIIADTVGEKAAGIHTHRFTPPFKTDIDTGWYNVGVMLFNNILEGRAIAWFWKNLLLDVNNTFYKSHGTCGDQKYLELFIPIFGIENICVFDEEPGHPVGISHQAPWCPDAIPPGKRRIFYHFSHFNHDFEKDTWRDYNNIEKPEWRPSTFPGLWQVYEDYYNVIKNADKLLSSRREAPLNPPPAGGENLEPANTKVTSGLEETKNPPLEGREANFRLDIIGNIKVDETKPERVKMLIASIRSLAFLKDHCRFMLLMEDASYDLQTRVRKEMSACGFDFMLMSAGFGSYGKGCMAMLKTCNAPYVLNFLEDHFCVTDSLNLMHDTLKAMDKFKVDVLKTSFYIVERKSIMTVPLFYSGLAGFIFDHDIVTQKLYEQYYGQRYFVSVHFLATREFAKKFWNRDLGPRPHEYELPKFIPGWEHRAMVPIIEILASIDDDHGEPGSNLLQRLNEKKFVEIYSSI